MPAFSNIPTALLRRHATTCLTAATRAQDVSRSLRATVEQHIIDSECRATKVALTQDKAAWRAYWLKRGQPGKIFTPYLT